MSDPHPSDHTSPLGRDMPCPSCGHVPIHSLPCGYDLGGGVECPCHARVPGVYPAA